MQKDGGEKMVGKKSFWVDIGGKEGGKREEEREGGGETGK